MVGFYQRAPILHLDLEDLKPLAAVEASTPQIGETDTLSNAMMHIDIAQVARDLEQRFGRRAWLSGPFDTAIFPPERDMF